MKKVTAFLTGIILILSLSACGSTGNPGAGETTQETTQADADAGAGESSAGTTEAATTDEPTAKAPTEAKEEKSEMGIEAFNELLAPLPLTVISTKYVVQDEQYKSLYPDMLQAVIQNNTEEDIKNAVIAFAAWDENSLPVKIKSSIDFTNGDYIKQVSYSDINLTGGSTFGDKNGYSIDSSIAVKSFTAIAVSFETFDGDTWENPYYDEWKKLYEGVKWNEDLKVDVTIEDSSFESKGSGNSSAGAGGSISEEELMKSIDEQELRVISTEYVIQDEKLKSLYPDMLQAVIQNDTDKDIKNAVLAFVAWDKNNLPVKIKGSIDFTNGEYIQQVKYSDINLVPGKTYGDSSGYSIDSTCEITQFKAVVVSYEDFDGGTWNNPLYENWCEFYEGKKLK